MASPEAPNPADPTGTKLTIVSGSIFSTFTPADSPVIIGRGDSIDARQPQVRIPSDAVSRHHVIVDYHDGQWIGRDNQSRNGTYINRTKVQQFDLGEGRIDVYLAHPTRGEVLTLTTYEPSNVYVGALAAKARTSKGISQRSLDEDKVVSAGALIAFEKGRSWPREATQRAIEEFLGWPPGEIARQRTEFESGHIPTTLADGERTEQIAAKQTAAVNDLPAEAAAGTPSVESGYLAEWLRTSLQRASARAQQLPNPTEPAYSALVAATLDELTGLEELALKASARAPELRTLFLQAHQLRRTLMIAAAQSPHATLGQLIFAARDRAGLSVDAAAMMAGLPVEVVIAAENGQAVSEPHTQALYELLDSLR